MVLSTLILAAAGTEPNPLAHVLDKEIIGPDGLIVTSVPILHMKTITMVIAFGILIWLIKRAAGSIETGPASQGNERYITKGKLAQVVEVLVLGLRDNFVKPQLGHKTDAFMPFLMTVFFFILINNMIGLVPLLDLQHLGGTLAGLITGGEARAVEWSHFAVVGGTATGSIAVTGALATVAFLFWNYNGIKELGLGGWLKHLTAGAPWFVAPLMVVVEIMGLIVKPAALAIRLFANMTAGHILLAVLMIFVAQTLLSVFFAVGIVSFVAGVAVFFLELFVAFLQAFIFFFLTTLFIAQLMHHEHHDEIHEGHASPFDAEHPTINDPAIPVSAV